MPLVPMKQTINVTKSPDIDGWGKPVPGDVITYRARVVEETKVVTNKAGEEAVTSVTILLDKLADISYDDAITYMNELGVTVERSPIRIGIKRGLNGKPMLTEVFV